MTMGKYFGTDGFRGEANVTLTADHAFKVGRFLGWYHRPGRILLGRDTRRSGDLLEHALAAGITSSGSDAHLLHVATTPSVAHVVRTEGFDCGVMISASHNPYYDNGIKLFNCLGEKMAHEVTAMLEDYLDGNPKDLPLAVRDGIGRTVDHRTGVDRYIHHLISLFPGSLRGMKVALDCANGAAWAMAGAVFQALGAETRVIHATPDGCNINRDCGSTHLETLRKFVAENSMDVGFAYDGDADRCLCVDELGNVLTGDHILYICGRYLQEQGMLPANTVVTTVMSNFGLYKAFDALDIHYAKTAVGDKYVYDYMGKSGACLGGEQSGHIIFSQHATTGDGILTSLKVMEVMIGKKMPLSRLCEGLTVCPQVLKNVRVTDKAALMGAPSLRAAIAAAEERLASSGRILVRPSGTEPLVRVMAEAATEELCRECVDAVVNAIETSGFTA